MRLQVEECQGPPEKLEWARKNSLFRAQREHGPEDRLDLRYVAPRTMKQ